MNLPEQIMKKKCLRAVEETAEDIIEEIAKRRSSGIPKKNFITIPK